MCMSYIVGEQIIIKDDLEVDKFYGEECFISQMSYYRGKKAKITEVLEGYDFSNGIKPYQKYRLDIDEERWCWTEEMFNRIPTMIC